jgi:asparagine synthase (glutamine-hydrolysing)
MTGMPPEIARHQLSQMLKALPCLHFYRTGTFIDEGLGLYVGWTALKNSFCEVMPVQSEDRNISLIFSGEEYPAADVRRQLKERGHCFDQQGASYLVHQYEDDGFFPSGLNGMFHGILIDKAQGTTTLFNDRYGMHRLCYHESKDAFYFAAEAKAILAVRPDLRTPNPQSLGEFVAFSCVLENRTIFRDIHVLPSASAWMLRDGTVQKKATYFDPRRWEEQPCLSMGDYYRELSNVVTSNLPRYFGGPQPMGIAITGGLDTRVIMACHKSAPGSLPSYTFGGPFRESQDVKVGRKVAELCQQPFQVITVGNEFLSHFSDYAERTVNLTEGGVDVYRSSDLYVSEKARQIAPAKIVGTYGSEVLRHAVMFKPGIPMPGLYKPDLLCFVDQASGTYEALRRQHPVTFAAFRQSPWYHHGVLATEQSQLTVRSPYLDNDFVRTVYRAPKFTGPDDDDVRLRLIADQNPALAQIPSDRGIGGRSVPIVSPLAHGFFEFTFKAEYAYDYGMPQWVAAVDHSFSALRLQRLFLGRHKFLHYRVWYRDSLSGYVRQMLLDPLTLSRPYLERKGVEVVVSGHLKGNRNYTTEIHKLLTLELLHRLFLDPR